MNAVIILAAIAALGGASRPLLVYVPEEPTPESCFANERLSAVIALTARVRIVRGSMSNGESLEAARVRTGADLAVQGTRRLRGELEEATVAIARASHAPETQTSSERARGERVTDLLAAMWPKDAPPLAVAGAASAASSAALDAACRRDADTAYRESGLSIGSAVRTRVAPPAGEAKGVLGRWAQGSALRREHRCKEAIPILRATVSALLRGDVAPTWRRAPKSETKTGTTKADAAKADAAKADAAKADAERGETPAAIDLIGGIAVAFDGGVFTGLDVKSGLELWRNEISGADPHLLEAGERIAIASLGKEIVGIDLEDGRVRWRLELEDPSPEVAQASGRVFVGGEETLLALDRAKGDILWRFDPLADLVSGPLTVGADLAIAAGSAIVLVDPVKGTETKRIDLGDEISAPPIVTGKGSIWAMVGGDQVMLIDPVSGAVRLRAQDLPGAEWPAAAVGEQLAVAIRRPGNKRFLVYLDGSTKAGVRRSFPGATAPVLTLPNFAGVLHLQDRPPAIIARDFDGNVLWRGDARRAASVKVAGEVVLTAVGTHALVLEPKKGARLYDFDLGEPVKDVVLGPDGGAALLESGVVYGLPSITDPRPRAWLHAARLELGACLAEADQLPLAAQAANQILERDPEDIDGLALLAASEARTKPRDAAEHWRQVAIAAPLKDPLQAEAESALATLAGVEARVVLDAPALDVLATGADTFVVRMEAKAAAMTLAKPSTPIWSRPGPSSRIAPSFPEHILIDRDLVRARDGSTVRKLAGDPPISLADAVFSFVDKGGRELVRQSLDGKPAWTQTFDRSDVVLLDGDDRILVVGATGAPGEVHVLRATSGERITMVPLSDSVRRAAISGPEVLVQLEKKLTAFDAESGRPLFAQPAGVIEISGLTGVGRGWLIAEKQRIRIVERTKGRPGGQVLLPAPVERLVVWRGEGERPAEVAIAALADGTLVAVDLVRLAVEGRLGFGPIRGLAVVGTRVVAVEDTGALLIIDPARKLRRARE